MECVAKLVADTMGLADYLVDVAVGMAINPIVYPAISNVVGKFCSEGTVDSAAIEFWRH